MKLFRNRVTALLLFISALLNTAMIAAYPERYSSLPSPQPVIAVEDTLARSGCNYCICPVQNIQSTGNEKVATAAPALRAAFVTCPAVLSGLVYATQPILTLRISGKLFLYRNTPALILLHHRMNK